MTGLSPAPAVSVFSKSFTSAEQTWSTANAVTLAHGLGVKPEVIRLFNRCKTAEANYVAGDEVEIVPTVEGTTRGIGIFIDDADVTNVKVIVSNAGTIQMHNKTNGNKFEITAASWKFIVKAFA